MQPLTHDQWEKHFVELREPILEKFPRVDRRELERIENDFDGLVALVQHATGLTPESTLQVIRTLDVEELNLGAGTPGEEVDDDRASLDQLVLQHGFNEAERPRIVERLRQLNRHLHRFPASGTYLELSVKEREGPQQEVVLDTQIPGFARIVAKSKEADLRAALADVRDDTIAQIGSTIGKRTEGSR
jgi:hypothetical protein